MSRRYEQGPRQRPAATTPRKCLKCGGQFPSEWQGHRVCDPCKATPEWRFAVREPVTLPQHDGTKRREARFHTWD